MVLVLFLTMWVIACSNTEVEVVIDSMPLIPGSELSITLTSASSVHVFESRDFAPLELGSVTWTTGFVGVTANEPVTTDLRLQLADGSLLQGVYEFTPQSGWGHSIRVSIGDSDPTEGCFGCGVQTLRLALPAPFQPTVNAAVWVWLTLDPRSDDVVF